jgi:predicted helicase
MAEEADRPVTLSDLLSFGTRLETRLATTLEAKLATSLEAKLATRLEAKMDAQHAETRRHFDVMAEDLRGDLNKVIDKVNATNDKVDRLITRNAIEHSAFVDAIADHEVRQRVLERILEPPATENS